MLWYDIVHNDPHPQAIPNFSMHVTLKNRELAGDKAGAWSQLTTSASVGQ